jgi:serine/threonine-protein kinase
VIHRDIKPGNLLVMPDLTTKVTDFGIAWAAAGVPLTQTGTVLGTAHYLSPEQGTGADVTPASDVYSLGVVAYECLAGHRPFDGDSAVRIAMAHVTDEPPPLPDDVPEDVRTLVAQALAKDPTERFTTAAAFGRAVTATQQRLEGGLSAPLATASAEPTAVIPLGDLPVAPGAPVLPPTLAAQARRRLEEARRPSRSTLLTAVAVAAVLLLLAAAIAASRSKPQHSLPTLSGLSLAAAEQALDDLKFDHHVTKEPSRTVRSGLVVRSDPAGPRSLREGSTVELFLSTGPAPVTLPTNLVGQDENTVIKELIRLGLVPRLTRVTTSRARAGTVITIGSGAQLREGDTVAVSVAQAPPPAPTPARGEKKKKGD